MERRLLDSILGHYLALRKMSDLNVDEYYSDDYEEEEDKKSMVKSVNTKHSSQQKSISPFTAHSQKSRSRHHLDQNNRPVNTNIKERLMAMEALLLLRWMQKEGVGAILGG